MPAMSFHLARIVAKAVTHEDRTWVEISVTEHGMPPETTRWTLFVRPGDDDYGYRLASAINDAAAKAEGKP